MAGRTAVVSFDTFSIAMSNARSYHPSLALGGIFLSVFGALWLSGASFSYSGVNLPMLSIIVVGSLLICAWALTTFRSRGLAFTGASDSAAGKRIRKGLILVNVIQWSSIGMAVLLLNLTGHVAWILPCVIFVVGIHFVPLAKLFRYRGYYLTAAALVLVALLYLFFGSERDSVALSLLATGATLWVSAIVLLRAV
jgi:hypothetical protein